MGSDVFPARTKVSFPVRIRVLPALDRRDRLTVAFRFILAIPHLILVGAPLAVMLSWSRTPEGGVEHSWTAGGGGLGAAAFVCAIIAWFAILFTASAPDGLTRLTAFYLRWRVRAAAYVALLRDEYPPFGDGEYPAEVELPPVSGQRDRLVIAFRPLLVIPQLIAIWLIGLVWCFTTIIAWFAILFTGRFPKPLYALGTGALRWTTRVEAYALLLTDEYPPFTLE